jgi:hypothetical protein
MTSLLGKSTLYDMLACIIPGYLLLQLAKLLFAPNITLEIDNVNNVSIAIGVFTLSYLTGLLLKWLMENILNGFLRNTPNRIRSAYKKSNCIFKEGTLPDKEGGLSDKEGTLPDKEGALPDKEEDLMKKYYIAYYKALKGNMNSSIPTLEAQIAFLRSILPVIFLYLATSYCWSVKIEHGYCLFIFITIIILIGCIALIWHLQDKLHQLVWEDAYYAELIDKSVTPTTNNP